VEVEIEGKASFDVRVRRRKRHRNRFRMSIFRSFRRHYISVDILSKLLMFKDLEKVYHGCRIPLQIGSYVMIIRK
jgi:hypothetical protein